MSSGIKDYIIRNMSREELDIAVDWAAAEGWNPGLHDADAFFAADPGGFWLGLYQGEPAATCSMVRYDDQYAFGGLYMVRPGLRGQGLGLALALHVVGQVRGMTLGLDGVLAQQENYKKLGFEYDFRSARYQGTGKGQPSPLTEPLGRFAWEEVEAYDRACFPAQRREFLKAWLAMPGITALAVRRAGALAGMGVLRPCRQGCKIGPLFADGKDEAAALVQSLAAATPRGQAFFWDVPQCNPAAVDMAKAMGLEEVFETARMHMGKPPAHDRSKVFGITTFELG